MPYDDETNRPVESDYAGGSCAYCGQPLAAPLDEIERAN